MFKDLQPGCKFSPGCKFASTFEVVQINLHPGANYAYERKTKLFLYILIGDFDKTQAFFISMLLKINKK